MSKTFKLRQRLLNTPADFTWNEMSTTLKHFGFNEIIRSTGSSRRKFIDTNKNTISLHQPHPGKIVKQYAIKQVIDRLTELGYIQNE